MRTREVWVAAVVAVLALVAAGCGTERAGERRATDDATQASVETEPVEITYVATEFAFEGPDTLPAGDVTITMDNQGKQPHELAISELLDGKAVDDVHALLERASRRSRPRGPARSAEPAPKPARAGSWRRSSGRGPMYCSASCPTRDRSPRT